MGYFTNLFNAALGKPAAQTFDLSNMSPDQVREFLRIGGSMETASGVSINESSAMRVAAAWRCVNIISGTVGTLPLDLIRRVSEQVREPARGHPLRKVLTVKPNQWQTPSEFRRMMQAHLMLRGNAYALKATLSGQVVGLVPLHPDRVEVDQLDDMTMRYRVSLKNGQYLTLTGKDVFHLRGMSLDGVKGLSVLSHMRESLGLALQSERAGARLMKDGQFIGGTLEHPNKLSPDAYERLKASVSDRHSGADNAGKAMILEEGMKFNKVGMSAVDLQFLQQRDFQRYDIAMFFGVPPHMLGATEKQTSWGSGIEQQGIGFVTYTLNDWLKAWEEAIKRDLIAEREWETLDARFYTQGLMRGDVKTRTAYYIAARQWGWLNPNEIRALEDMNPREDEGGEEYAVPPNTAGAVGMGHNGGPPLDEGEGDEPPQPPRD
ncbi:MAG: phage portal protein [Rhizobiaceae bacterium]|nr:phage portal protein [Rhizobiaceae bacterium]MCV0406333.1 phage portal protein [Rhizobiaceae bacterium]